MTSGGYEVLHREMELLAEASPEEQEKLIRSMTPVELARFDANYEQWAHENQLPPRREGWSVWLMMAGRGFGKTRAGSEWIFGLGKARPGVRIALIGATIGEARSVMVEGVSGLLAVARNHGCRLRWEPSLNRLSWPNGSQAELYSGENANGLRGPEFDFAWCDELAKWSEVDEAWINLRFALRRGSRPRALVTTTPRPIDLLRNLQDDPHTIVTGGRTSDNINLDEQTVELLTATYGGTRIGDQELEGKLTGDLDGALWTREIIEAARAPDDGPRRRLEFDRMVIGVDPPAGVAASADACGIVVAGSSGNRLYVLEDATVKASTPEGWARRVAAAARRWDADLVVAESNNGGAMVGSVLNAVAPEMKVRLVHATAGKCARAEPVAVRFETGKALFAGRFPELEAQLRGMIAGGDYQGPGRSPDRADAMVWAMTALTETRSGCPRVRWL